MSNDPKNISVPVFEETLSLDTRKVVSGRVRVATRTEEIDQTLPAALSSVDVEVVRVPVDHRIDVMPQVVTEGRVTIIPVVEERLVVTRELYLREEVHVRRVERTEAVEVEATTRRQIVEVERIPADPGLQSPKNLQSEDDRDDL